MTWFDKVLDGVALVYAVFFFPVPLFWLILHSRIHFWRRFGNRAFLVALPVWTVSGVALVTLRGTILSQRIDRNALTWLLGAGLIVLAVWTNRQVHRQFSLRRLAGLPEINRARPDGGVVRAGIYSRVRHPRYTEFMLSFLGLAFLTGAVGIFLLAIVTILLYLIVAPLEERELRDSYGAEYEAYARAVPRFLPHLWHRDKSQTSS
ncbi:MAG: isoprenylcysteine carboxylmethyltransferase family protein [Acidobacteria bacterium]|nr:isoprenylcysteine carboxylmethyltransferase family protein [Acidobacteriota bacterium]